MLLLPKSMNVWSLTIGSGLGVGGVFHDLGTLSQFEGPGRTGLLPCPDSAWVAALLQQGHILIEFTALKNEEPFLRWGRQFVSKWTCWQPGDPNLQLLKWMCYILTDPVDPWTWSTWVVDPLGPAFQNSPPRPTHVVDTCDPDPRPGWPRFLVTKFDTFKSWA